MRQRWMKRNWRFMALVVGIALLGGVAWQWRPGEVQAESNLTPASEGAELSDGQELFHRSWLPDDPRSPNGDGLGPMFNETSCAGCHNQGGPGGGGPTSKNVLLLTAFIAQPQVGLGNPMTGPGPSGGGSNFPGSSSRGGSSRGAFAGTTTQPQAPVDPVTQRKAIVERLVRIHPEFEKSSSVVLHHFGTSPQHDQWRRNVIEGKPQLTSTEAVGVPNTTDFDPAIFHSPPATEPVSAVEEPAATPAQPPQAPTVDAFTQPSTTLQGSQPAFQFPVQQVQSINFLSANAATGIPLVDEVVQKMRQLQQEARQDLSGIHNQGAIVLSRSQRNTSALFGTGVIDAIPDEVIEAAAKAKHEDFPRVSGRVHRLPDNTIGKFGWKAQKATLREFTLAACANELGLDVPGHAQPAVPYEERKKSQGHDMTEKEAGALVAFVRNLPAPIQEMPDHKLAAKLIEDGKAVFESVGCAVCHKENMGEAKGIYSDLLLHDMGEQLQASGSYGSSFTPQEFDPNEPPEITDASNGSDPQPAEAAKKKKPEAAAAGEWRTPPLWGIRDSAPYLHDGRAGTLEQAIALHGGEGSDAAIRFFMLPAKKQQQMVAFLKTLRAPDQHAAK